MNDAGGDELVPARPRDPRTHPAGPAKPPKTCEQELEEKDAEIVRLRKEKDAEIVRLRKEKDAEIVRLRKELEEKDAEIVRLKEQVAKLERLLLPYSPIVPLPGKTPWDKKSEGPEFQSLTAASRPAP
jgi:hypothetical protein